MKGYRSLEILGQSNKRIRDVLVVMRLVTVTSVQSRESTKSYRFFASVAVLNDLDSVQYCCHGR